MVDKLLTPSEVAAIFRVDPKTVTRWARDGRISSIRTLGGHRRYHEAEVQALLEVGGRARTPVQSPAPATGAPDGDDVVGGEPDV